MLSFGPISGEPVSGAPRVTPAAVATAQSGKAVGRMLFSWLRKAARALWPRTTGRDAATWTRIARWTPRPMTNEFPVKTLTFVTGEKRRVGFDYSPSPEAVASETLTNPSIPAVTGLTITGAAVTSATFDGIDAGKCVTALITADTAGSYIVVCQVDASGGGKPKVPMRIVVADPPTS